MAPVIAENASESQQPIAFLINAPFRALRQSARVIGSREILNELERRGIEKSEIARVLKIHPSQVSRLYATDEKPRHLRHDEAVMLAAKYGLEPVPEAKVLPAPVWRLVAHHVAAKLALPLAEDDPRLQDVAADLAAFSRFFRNPRVQGTVEAAENFFQAMDAARQEPEPANPQENDPQPSR